MDDNVPLGLDNAVTQFCDYEAFLDSQITASDLFYLEDEELARQLVELGYRGSGEIVKRDDFNSRKIALAEAILAKGQSKKALASEGLDIICPVARALASREDANRTGKMSTIIFIRDLNTRGQEISGYIDYAHRLKTEDFTQYFTEKKKLLPKPGDLSFYNWETQNVVATSSPNYTVLAENPSGLLFKNKRDRKILNVDPSHLPYQQSSVEQKSPAFLLQTLQPLSGNSG
ncbi:uncharacterized protein DEA37_0007671 [Paragonimus westermani]|uniref:Cilia- and flagella-associated protein 299 n=1 Tax=Paragonimus westermani TaxID=34504 RepID=A0A5J4NRS4_9TREM|nr:uncharacterized protein DEA37_0007671 [Paragonimus westermani]